MKNLPKVKLGQIGVDSNIVQNHSSSPYEDILGQVEVGSNIAQNLSSSL